MNKSNDGYINEKEIIEFMRKNEKFVNTDDYDALMRRIDLEDDLVINYNEFLDFLIPQHMPNKNSEENRPKSVQTVEKNEKFVESTKKTTKNVEENAITNKFHKSDNEDKPLDSEELNESPRFQDSKELASQSFETPEKSKGNKTRASSIKTLKVPSKLQELFIVDLEIQRKLEFCKQNLIMLSNFSVNQLFFLIDKENKGEILVYDIEKFLESLEIEASRDIIWKIFEKFGFQEELSLSFFNFSKIFECVNEDFSEILRIEGEEELEEETLQRIKNVFEFLIASEYNFEGYRKELEGTKENELKEVFIAMDEDRDGEINENDVKSLMKSLGILISDKDVVLIVSRYARKLRDSFNFEEFARQILNQE